MLSSDLVRGHLRGGELRLKQPSAKERERIVELGGVLLATVRRSVGQTRDEVREALAEITVPPRERKLNDGLVKLILDACEFGETPGLDPVELRREVFQRAAALRREGSHRVDREAVLDEVAGIHGVSRAAIDAGLFADLRGAHQLLAVEPLTPEGLAESYERAQIQAVLLRAVRVVADVEVESSVSLRALFRKLKFHRLLFTLEALDAGKYRVQIDGPYSLFESSTKYGLGLALALPALEACRRLELHADICWGKQRERARFCHQTSREEKSPTRDAPSLPQELPDEVRELFLGFSELDSPWRVALATEVFQVAGLGLCVPDLVFDHPTLPSPIYLEVLGFWSREAVWRRVELCRAGLAERVLFAVSDRLRVSESVLGEGETAALCVFKGRLSPRLVERRLEELARR